MVLDFLLDRFDRDKYSCEGQIYHDSNPEVHHGHVKLVGSAWSITQSEDEASHQIHEIKPFEDNTQNLTGRTK